jgi:hypothetical protein
MPDVTSVDKLLNPFESYAESSSLDPLLRSSLVVLLNCNATQPQKTLCCYAKVSIRAHPTLTMVILQV